MGEELRDVVPDRTDKAGDGRKVRPLVAGQGDEGDVVAARAFNLAAADDALRIGKQDDFEQNRRRVGFSAGLVVLVAGVEAGQIEFMIDQMIQCVFEAAGQKLFAQVNSEKTRAGVDVFVTGHHVLQNIVSFFDLDTRNSSRHDA